MQNLPHPWAEYARLQARSSLNSTIDSYSWGIEEEMNRLVADPYAYANLDTLHLKRVSATASRRERLRATIRRRHETELASQPIDTVRYIEARQLLTKIRAKVTPLQWRLLLTIGEGEGYTSITAKNAVRLGAARTQMFRLRRQLADFRPAA